MNNTLLLSDPYLKDSRFILCLDSQDIVATCENVGIDPNDITGVLVDLVGDGNNSEIWLTESKYPFATIAIYHNLTYYKGNAV